MIGPIALVCVGTVMWVLGRTLVSFLRNIQRAKATGLPYCVGPFMTIGYIWMALGELAYPILSRIPIVKDSAWLRIIHRQASWLHPRGVEEELGDTYILVTPTFLYMKTSNAELSSQLTTRKTDFRKPVEGYKIVDLFGRSILTQEGDEWKRHRKIVGPSFSEKSNKLVFEESLRQAEGMIGFWAGQGKNTKHAMTVQNVGEDSATLSLHVICAAGFGIPQSWPNEGEEKLGGKGVPGFSEHKPSGGHTMTFADALCTILRNLPWFILFSPWLMSKSPFAVQQRAYTAWHECTTYFEELLAIKKKQRSVGEKDEGTMDLLGPMVKANYEGDTEKGQAKSPSTSLSKAEILGNCFIFFFAGHETTANNIHFSIIYLAMELPAQKFMQDEIDEIVGDKPTSEWSYYNDMPRLYNSMVGAVIHEELRLVPAIPNLPKTAVGDQTITMDGKQYVIPADTFVHMNIVSLHRNPKYWPEDPNQFMPERWLPSLNETSGKKEKIESAVDEDVEPGGAASFDTTGSASLMKPEKGSYIPFSDGARGCPGKRFAQVESTAVLSAIFQKYSVELDVSDWATDGEVEDMSKEEKARVYAKATKRAKDMIARAEQVITVQLLPGDKVPVRFVERGQERFSVLLD